MDEIDEFFDSFSPEVAHLAQQLRTFVTDHHPDATETLHAGWKVVSYGGRYKFCAIAPHGKWVNLQFHNGVGLDDPQHRLQGTGKRIRHVKIRAGADLVRQASQQG